MSIPLFSAHLLARGSLGDCTAFIAGNSVGLTIHPPFQTQPPMAVAGDKKWDGGAKVRTNPPCIWLCAAGEGNWSHGNISGH